MCKYVQITDVQMFAAYLHICPSVIRTSIILYQRLIAVQTPVHVPQFPVR